MKATVQDFPVLLYITLREMDILLKAAENWFPVVLFTILSKMVLQCELAFK